MSTASSERSRDRLLQSQPTLLSGGLVQCSDAEAEARHKEEEAVVVDTSSSQALLVSRDPSHSRIELVGLSLSRALLISRESSNSRVRLLLVGVPLKCFDTPSCKALRRGRKRCDVRALCLLSREPARDGGAILMFCPSCRNGEPWTQA